MSNRPEMYGTVYYKVYYIHTKTVLIYENEFMWNRANGFKWLGEIYGVYTK